MLYKGYTSNLENRLRAHKYKKVKTTSRSGPWKLVYYEVFDNKIDALREEKFLKSGKGRESLKERLKYSLN